MDLTNETQIFGENLRALRQREHLTQKELARIMGIGVGSLRRIDRGDFPLRFYVSHLERILDHFGVTADSLFVPMEKADE